MRDRQFHHGAITKEKDQQITCHTTLTAGRGRIKIGNVGNHNLNSRNSNRVSTRGSIKIRGNKETTVAEITTAGQGNLERKSVENLLFSNKEDRKRQTTYV